MKEFIDKIDRLMIKIGDLEKVTVDLRAINHNLGYSKNHTEYLLSRSEEENQELKDQLKQFEFQLRDKTNSVEGGAEEYYNNLEYKMQFTKLTKTGINSNYERVFDFAEDYSTSQIKKKVGEIIKSLNIPEWDGDYENLPEGYADGIMWRDILTQLTK